MNPNSPPTFTPHHTYPNPTIATHITVFLTPTPYPTAKAKKSPAFRRTSTQESMPPAMSDDDTFDPVLVLSRLLRKHAFNLYTPHACLLLINPGQASLTIEYGMGIMEPYVGRIIQNSDGVAGHVLSTNQPHFIPDYLQWAKRYNRLIPDTQARFNAVAGTPVYRKGELWAILSFIWENGTTLQPEEMLATLTEIGAAATDLIARLAEFPTTPPAPLPIPNPLSAAL